jgi:hypothetical protein
MTVEELKKRFPVKDVAPYGSCIVVPGAEFDPDWETELDEQGYKCHMTDIYGKPVTLVKLKSAGKSEGEKEVYQPHRQPPSPLLNPENRWKLEEDELIIALWNQKKNKAEIHVELRKRFPNRSIHAVTYRIGRLIKAGKIPARWHKGEHKQKESFEKRRSPREDFGFKMKHSNEIIEFARKLASQTDPAYSSRDIAKKIEEKFNIKVSNVAVSEWLSSVKAKPAGIEPTTPAPSTPVPTPVPFSINTTLTIQLSVNCNDRNAVINFLEIIEKMGLSK